MYHPNNALNSYPYLKIYLWTLYYFQCLHLPQVKPEMRGKRNGCKTSMLEPKTKEERKTLSCEG